MTESADKGMMLIISGPSGVGKTTITHNVEEALGAVFSVSVTTRAKTEKDVEGVDYSFVDEPEFLRRKNAGEFLECAEVFGNWYGTPRGPAERALKEGQLFILEIDVEGAALVKEKMPQAFSVFVLPPNLDVLLGRLRGRKREDESIIQRRFKKAVAEIVRAWESGVYDYFIVNDELDYAVSKAVEVVRREWEQRRQCPAPSKS